MITQLGIWHDYTGQLTCKWGILEGPSGPALLVTNDSDEPMVLIPFQALKSVLEMVKEP